MCCHGLPVIDLDIPLIGPIYLCSSAFSFFPNSIYDVMTSNKYSVSVLMVCVVFDCFSSFTHVILVLGSRLYQKVIESLGLSFLHVFSFLSFFYPSNTKCLSELDAW